MVKKKFWSKKIFSEKKFGQTKFLVKKISGAGWLAGPMVKVPILAPYGSENDFKVRYAFLWNVEEAIC